jgi:hypothetical protein
MESKNYTNIAGSAFQPFVNKQLEIRKSVISKEDRTSSDLQWLTNRNLWIRISSGTNIDQDNTLFSERGDTLSRRYILQAGLTDHSKVIDQADNIFRLRSGIGPDGAYGLGGTEQFGFRPMPGLEGLSIKTGGKLGTLREATFEFTCYNIEQLNIMDALYMKLGFSILIEWGHIPFLDNDGVLVKNPQPMDFYGVQDKEELMADIQKRRVLHSGNYDAMWGTVKNFSYSFEGNGQFKCKVDIVGAGDILESLKINQSGTAQAEAKSPPSGSSYPVVANQNLSLLNEALFKIFDKEYEPTNSTGASKIKIDFSTSYFTTINPYYKKLDIYLESLGTTNISSYNNNTNELAKYGYQYSLINSSSSKLGNGGENINIPLIQYPTYFYSKVIMDYEINKGEESKDSEEEGLPQVYITLGNLLILLMSTGGLYTKKDDKSKPFNYIDVNPETNRCFTFPGHCSLDPTVCIIASETLPFGIDNTVINALRSYFPFYDDTTPDFGGKFMFTLVNINFITSVLAKYQKQSGKGDVMFVDFLQDILTGISKACGGFNEFRIVPDDDTRCVRIFDDRRITKPLKEGELPYTVIPVLGKNSLAYNFNYTSKIAPNMAAQITIAAQAQPEGVGQEALSFSHLTKGLINRLSPIIISATSEGNNNLEDEALSSDQRFIESRDFIEKIYDAIGSGILAETESTTNFEEENTETNADNVGPTITGLKDDEASKKKFSDALDAIIGNLTKIYQNKNPKTSDDEESIKRLKDAKLQILANYKFDSLQFFNKDRLLNRVREDNSPNGKVVQFDLKTTDMYAYIASRISDNDNYEGVAFSDTDLENLWEAELDRLADRSIADL